MVLSHDNQLTMAYTPRGFAGYSATSPFTSTQFDSLLTQMNASFEYDQLIERLTIDKATAINLWIEYLDIIDAALAKVPFVQSELNGLVDGGGIGDVNSNKFVRKMWTNNILERTLTGSKLTLFLAELAGSASADQLKAMLETINQYVMGVYSQGNGYKQKTTSVRVKKMAASILRKVVVILASVPIEQWHAAT